MSESENRKMTVTIQVRATPAEKALLKARAAAFGISIGGLVRETIFRTTPKSKTDLSAIQALAASRADLGRVGGLLKGWLGGSFSNSPSPDQVSVRDLLHKIEIAQAEVLEAVKKLVSKP
jgi:predicted aconitase